MFSITTIVTFLAWFFGGFVNGVTGAGIAIIALPILAFSLDIKVAIAASSIISFLISAIMCVIRWKGCDFSTVKTMLIGVIPGTIAGTYVLYIISEFALYCSIGVLLLIYVAWQSFFHNATCAHTSRNSLIAGFLAGFIGTAASFSGPPVVAYLLLLRWEKLRTIGTLCVFFLPMTLIACVAQGVAGFYDDIAVWYGVLFGMPGALIGLYIGNRMTNTFSPEFFKNILLLLIFLAGLACFYFAFRN